ncbi:LytS/YhcK type 5TM receptor domain-containing protein [Ancylomarina sp.]|uniref:hybrid sensor histidine kinase/response regulator n=1 Tax=Ancylomarina sp. TaxID=1970196 RepID=UPI003569BE76
MKDSIIIELLQNTAILLAFAMVYENFWIKDDNYKSIGKKILIGLILSGICVVLMFTPWTWAPGIVFDTRSVMISISGLFFGPIPTVITMFITSMVRLIIGGDGQWMGIAVIISSGIIGLLWRRFRPDWKSKKSYLELLVMGILVHITMSLCTFLLPPDKILPTLRTIALPLVFIYSPATMLLGIIMLRQYKNTQNRLAQSKLDESERRFTQVLESGNIVSLLLNNDGCIKYCNHYLLQITGYVQNEVLEKNWFELFIPKNIKDEVYQVFSDSMISKSIVKNYENVILTKSGEELQISWHNTIFHSDSNDVTGVACVGVNNTKRKSYEIKLEEKNEEYKQINIKLIEAKEKAEESERLKTAFLANMSHEIRTPMNGILGFTELLNKPDLSDEEQKEFISIIEESGRRMLNTINDIIDISKIESGLIGLNNLETNINQQVELVYIFFKPEAESKGLNFSFKNSLPVEKANIKTDKEKTQKILINLVKNAIKFCDEGSIEFGYEIKGNDLEFFVKDTGIGIPNDRQAAIFERFIQADISDSRAFQGSGLGLAITKSYVEMLDGKIWVESEEGKGSVFYFTIPYNPELKVNNTSIKIGTNYKNENLINKLKIIIADDDEISAMLIEIELEKYSKTIIKVRTGAEVVEICRNNPDIDLILMDIRMPTMDGYEATRQIRQFNKNIIIIAQTAYGLLGDREKALESGCNDYISKPILKDKLIELIHFYFNI